MPRVRKIRLPGGYVQYLVDGEMRYPVYAPPAEALSDAHLRFLGVALPEFVDQPLINATVFVNSREPAAPSVVDASASSLVFLLQSISFETVGDRTQIIVTAIWDQNSRDMSADDRLWLSQWSVSCHLIVIGKPIKTAKHSRSAKTARSLKGGKELELRD
jgi:hypothetical protein